MILVGAIIILYHLLLSIVVIMIKITRWLVWRIAQYNKGALAAMTLIITLIIGVVELVIRTK